MEHAEDNIVSNPTHDRQADMATPPDDAPARTRLCLKCREDFPSSWAGERVCGRCKGRSDWRKGSPMQVYSSGRRR